MGEPGRKVGGGNTVGKERTGSGISIPKHQGPDEIAEGKNFAKL